MKPKIVRLYSENNDFQHAEVLKNNREKRTKYREFFVEGVKSIKQLLAHDWPVHSFLYSHEKPLSDWAKEVLSKSRARTHFELPAALMQKLSDKEEVSELLAIAPTPPDNLSRITFVQTPLAVVFDRPNSPGNLGTLIRSCDALRVDGLIVSGHAADVYHPQTVRGSMGALFSMPIVRVPSHKEVQDWISSVRSEFPGLQVVGTSAKADDDVSEYDFTQPSVILLGNETMGLSANYKSLCTAMVKIPISGAVSSLNVSCAASIVLYEVQRQRMRKATGDR